MFLGVHRTSAILSSREFRAYALRGHVWRKCRAERVAPVPQREHGSRSKMPVGLVCLRDVFVRPIRAIMTESDDK